ncbi:MULTISPECIES: YvrJ family protein [Bacillaceae]|uniref:YvrJ family protein n=1 Tax=Bacillaceae TaxID=186817 RepID=UPI000BA531F7|nr:YvrJ family protein [Virgibacillus sp. 7505]PAE14766.1 YvrJ family protein [Virgibacillus sp. 7505]
MTTETIISMIGNLGFPIVVSFYLLIRLEQNIKRLEQTLQVLIEQIQKGGS